MGENGEWKNLVEEAEEATQSLCDQYYKVMDTKRSNIGTFYAPSAILVYEGHRTSGQSAISDFYSKFPSSNTRVTSLDAQPIDKAMTENNKSILISAAGTMKFPAEKLFKTFTQHFVLSMINEKWLITSDTVRLSDSEYQGGRNTR